MGKRGGGGVSGKEENTDLRSFGPHVPVDIPTLLPCPDTQRSKICSRHHRGLRQALSWMPTSTMFGIDIHHLKSGDQISNKHKTFSGIVPEKRVSKLFLCRFFGGKGKHTNKIPRKSQENAGTVRDNPAIIPGQSRKIRVFVSSCLLVHPAL